MIPPDVGTAIAFRREEQVELSHSGWFWALSLELSLDFSVCTVHV